jgi:hypothetical protein
MSANTVQTLAATVIFSLAFIAGSMLHRQGATRRRGLVSFSAGAAVAYIFVHLSPELESARKVFVEKTSHLGLLYAWYSVHLSTMLGFVLFYGLDQFVLGLKSRNISQGAEKESAEEKAFWVHVGVLGAYVWLVAYLLVDTLDEGEVRIWLYAVAMGLHFLTLSSGLHEEYKKLYERKGVWLLVVCSLGGWATGLLVDLQKAMVAVLLGFVAGAVIVNTLIGELPREKDGRFFPFVFGALFYTVLLLVTVSPPSFKALVEKHLQSLIDRVSGPMAFRFVLQPAMASIFAIRDGLKDARAGRPAFFWEIFTNPGHRRELLREGWKSTGKVFIIAVTIDAVYQYIVLHWFFPLEAVLVAAILAFIPYLILRGPVNRIANLKKDESANDYPKER